ncbi:glycosyl hydrolase family 35 [Phlyctema vagabunda]|uniref:beta-galactosidase n=1 Tax=Phlyctema vagabunda TaxID=108571 RepID=A0ABR4PN41_9HELO
MRWLSFLFALSTFTWMGAATDNGLQTDVTWDPYSITINGSRVFIFSGEFHYQRMPVPEMWPDIFQKFRANGLNAVSIYFFWSYHSASEGVFDFETSGKNVQKVLDYAKEAGLYVIARAGPYCNAETNGGGLALWGSDGSLGNLRTSDERYHQAWLPYIARIGAIIAANEITKGGPVIMNQVENELQETTYSPTNTLVLYMEQLKKAYLEAGITVPLSHNEKGQRSISWSTDYKNVGGAVNMYGLDSYPGGLSCTNPDTGFNLVRNYYQWFSNYSYTQPNYFPEFEGGWFSAWGSGSFYDDCKAEHSPEFADVYYKNNLGQRTTLLNLYMAWGGTNWGHSAAPVVYSSYDYSAPLRETRQIWDKFSQTKLISLFTRVSKGLLKTNMEGNGTGYSVSSPDIWSWVLRNPDTGAGFYTLQHSSSKSRASTTFSAYLNTSSGPVTVPNVNLDGRQSKILVTDYPFGSKTLLYSSAEVLTFGVFDVEVLALYLNEGQVGQFAFKNANAPVGLTYTVYGSSTFESANLNGTGAYVYTQGAGQTVVKFSNGVLLYLLEVTTAWKFWAPATTSNPDVASNEQIFVLGPYLVRSASISHGVVHISGDSDKATTIEVYTGNPAIETIDWNGIRLPATKTAYGSVTAKIPGAEDRTISLPALTNWKGADSFPERLPSYDDSHWIVCNKTSTLSPVAPLTLPVLFSSDYGFYTGAKIYRGYFDGKTTNSVNITASGGLAFGWTAWVNGVLIGGNVGNATQTTTNAVLSLPPSALQATDNVITVVVDYHGHDQTSTAKGVENPRGLLGASLLPKSNSTSTPTGFKTWKIQGNAGGSANIDAVRGPMNEGGLYAERLGWHLPSYPYDKSSQFNSTSPSVGLASSGIQFYITTFHLNIDSDLDVPLGIELSAPSGTVARVMIWINGYQYGKYVPHIGPQTRFPVPPGVINNRGKNTIALSLWAMQGEGARLDKVELFAYGQYQTDFKFNQDWTYLQPGWETGREKYA